MIYDTLLKNNMIELHEDIRYCYEDGSIDFCTFFKTADGSVLLEKWIGYDD